MKTTDDEGLRLNPKLVERFSVKLYVSINHVIVEYEYQLFIYIITLLQTFEALRKSGWGELFMVESRHRRGCCHCHGPRTYQDFQLPETMNCP